MNESHNLLTSQPKLAAYYACLIAVLLGYALTTVFHGGQALMHADRIAQSEKAKRTLVRQHLELQQQLASRNSLSMVALSEKTTGFEKISQPLTIQSAAQLALR